ncbi:hypothetical protein Tco_1539011 [Tanacetum coccineum]
MPVELGSFDAIIVMDWLAKYQAVIVCAEKIVIVNFVMAKDPSIPRRNKVNWHYARDDPMFTTINVISRNEDTQLYRTILPAKLTNEDIRNSESYKEYYAIASGKIPPKTKASKKKADSDATTKQKPPTVPKEKKARRLEKESRRLKRVPDAPDYDSDDDISWKSSENDQDEDKNEDDENVQNDDDDAKSGDDELKSQDDQDDDDDEAHTESEDDGDDFIHLKLTTHDDETTHEEETDEDDTFDPIPGCRQQSSSVSSGFVSNMLNPNQDTGVDAIFGHNAEATSLVNIPVTAIAEPSFFAPTNRPPTPTPLFTQLQQPQILTLATTPSSSLQNLPDFVPGTNKMKEAVDVAVQLKSDRIREEAQAENQQFLDSIDEGMKKVIKEQVKSEVSKITPQIEKLVNEQLESEVLVRSSKEAKTSHAVAANLSELELKKILIDKMEANKSISRSDIQRQLYKALVDAYEADKILLDTYGDTVTIKRPRDGADDDQEPSAGTDRGSKR